MPPTNTGEGPKRFPTNQGERRPDVLQLADRIAAHGRGHSPEGNPYAMVPFKLLAELDTALKAEATYEPVEVDHGC